MKQNIETYTSEQRALIARGVIARFGGVAALARVLGHRHPTTVQQWWTKGSIPTARQQDLYLLARMMDIDLPAEAFFDPPSA